MERLISRPCAVGFTEVDENIFPLEFCFYSNPGTNNFGREGHAALKKKEEGRKTMGLSSSLCAPGSAQWYVVPSHFHRGNLAQSHAY